MEQLLLPGFKPLSIYFKEKCGKINPLELLKESNNSCVNLSSLMGIYFIMGHYESSDNVPESLVGLDCPFDDSPTIFACCSEHIEQLIKELSYELEEPPDVVINRFGELQEKFCDSETEYSFGRETLSELWGREKWRWGF